MHRHARAGDVPGGTGSNRTRFRFGDDSLDLKVDAPSAQRAGLEDMRIHDAGHSFASRALALGESLPMIGKLLGHARVETTARYAHLAEGSVRESAVPVFDRIAADILDC